MRKMIAIAVSLLLLSTSLLACSSTSSGEGPLWPPEEGNLPRNPNYLPLVEEFEGMRFVIENVERDGADIHFENDNNKEVGFGLDFSLYYLDNGRWVPVTFTGIDGWNLPLVPEAGVWYLAEGHLDFKLFFGGLKKGTYRFVKEVYAVSQAGSAEPLAYLYTEFIVK